MLRAAFQKRGWFLAVAGFAAVAGAARAQTPRNPLRGEPAPAAYDLAALPPAPLPTLEAQEPAPLAAPSVVPPQFGQPESLPPGFAAPPGDSYLPPEAYAAWPGQGSPPLVHRWFAEPWFGHSDPNDPARHIGIGQPLVGTSWRNRPWFVGTFVGGVLLDDLVSDRIYQADTSIVGLRLGLDFDHYWGLEARWAFANPELENAAGAPLAEPARDYFADVSLAYYPLGDARWRPYLVAGLGFQTFRFNNELDQRISEAAFAIPLGFGVKYYYSPWWTLRFDFVDHLGVGNERVSGMHNISLQAGVEFRFGGSRPSYFPWHNNTAYW